MDIGISWDVAHFRGDWAVNDGDLETDPGGLRSAVLLSLFTDRLAPSGFVPPAGSPPERRGWWGDTFLGQQIGSWLWTLDRSKKTGDVTLLVETQDFCSVALQWLVDAGIVATVTVRTAWMQPDVIGIAVVLTKPDGITVPLSIGWAWQGI